MNPSEPVRQDGLGSAGDEQLVEFAAMVAEQCATLADTLPAQRLRAGHVDSPIETGNAIAEAIRTEFGL
jgi:hypothetical protein